MRRYWTAERMRAATPLPLDHSLPESAAGPPVPGPHAFPAAGRPTYVRADPSGDAPVSIAHGKVVSASALDSGKVPRATEVPGTTGFPARTHGKVFFSLGSSNYVCSATVVATTVESVVFTAGHCVNDPEAWGWASNFEFVPGYRDGSTPFGEFAAVNLWAPSGWTQDENKSFDLGAAVLGTNNSGQKVEAAVGARGIAFNQSRDQLYTSWGYPAAPPFGGGLLYTCASGWLIDDPFPNPGAPPPIGINCDMTGGSSGGGWVVGDQYVNSVNSFGYPSYPNIMFGPYFGEAARSLYLAVCGCTLESDNTAPETTITAGPSGTSNDSTPTFGFSSNEPGSTFECSLDSGPFDGGCTSPRTVGPLADGAHTFAVRATDSASNVDPTPASSSFTIDTIVNGSASAKQIQKQRGGEIVAKAKAKAGEDLAATATGTVKVRQKKYELEPQSRSVASGEQTRLKLKPKTRGDAKAIAKALKKGRQATAKLIVELSDAVENVEAEKLSVTLTS